MLDEGGGASKRGGGKGAGGRRGSKPAPDAAKRSLAMAHQQHQPLAPIKRRINITACKGSSLECIQQTCKKVKGWAMSDKPGQQTDDVYFVIQRESLHKRIEAMSSHSMVSKFPGMYSLCEKVSSSSTSVCVSVCVWVYFVRTRYGARCPTAPRQSRPNVSRRRHYINLSRIFFLSFSFLSFTFFIYL